MGKHVGTNSYKTDTKVLFKKSNITIRTLSRTCSDASQVARSGIMQIQKTISKTNDKQSDKVKKDLSVETRFCVLRRYYKSKHKRDKCSVYASTTKSKCSTVADTEIESVDEFKPDVSGCGDSRNKFEIANQINPTNIDITAMMLENLKGLLNDCIRKHVLEDTETKKKLLNVLDSIVRSLDAKISITRSSCSTYIVERNGEGYKVRNKKTATNSITCQYCKQKQTSIITSRSSSVLFRKYSRFTIPFPYNNLQLISTLSIPRNLYRKEKIKNKDVICKVKKTLKKNVDLTNKKDRRVVINVSSCETSPDSKKSIIRSSRIHDKKSRMKRRGVLFVPQMFYKSTTEYTSTTEVEDANNRIVEKTENNLDAMPSIVKSIYADDPANVTSTDNITTQQNRNDNFTMTETPYPSVKAGNSISNVGFHEAKYCCKTSNIKKAKTIKRRFKSHSNFGYINRSLEFPNMAVPNKRIAKYIKIITSKSRNKIKKYNKISHRQRSHFQNSRVQYENIKNKHFTYLYKKAKSKRLQENEFLIYIRNVFKYFANYEGKRNMKLEIHCNVHPLFDDDKKPIFKREEFQDYELHIVAANENKIESVKVDNAIEPEINSGIIPLLDGAASQAKYIFKSDNSTNKSENSLKYTKSIDHGTEMTSLEVSKELKELKLAIKKLAATADRIVIEHLKRKHNEKPQIDSNNGVTTKSHLENANDKLIKLSNLSKGLQFSNTVAKGQLLSGIKLSKEPKRVEEFTNRLKKRSSSYHVIDSESILKVTDMTSSVMKPKEMNQPKLKKSKSLLQFTTEANKQRLLAFFCDESRRNDKLIYNISSSKACRPRRAASPRGSPGMSPNNSPCNLHYCKERSSPSIDNKIFIPVKVSQESYQGCNHEYCSSVYVDIDKPTITVKKRSGLPFWEGCLYCILLWIPLVVIIYLFYDYVLKDMINPPVNVTTAKPKLRVGQPQATPLSHNEAKTSRFLLKLSDFGF